MSLDLPKAVQAYFLEDKRGSEATAHCFTEDAVVKDESHTYKGRSAIQKWKADASARYNYTSEPFAVEDRDGKIIVSSHVAGNFPGSPVDLRYIFVIEGDRIASLEIVA